MKLKRIICLLLALLMVTSVAAGLAACKGNGEEDPPETTKAPNNPVSPPSGGGSSGGGGGSSNPPVEKYPWLSRVYHFSAESFSLAPDEKDGIVNYLKGVGALAADETNEDTITEALNMLAYGERREILFLTANTVKVISADYTYEAEYLYKIDVYKNVLLYDVNDTAMKDKLTSPAYTLSVDGKSLTLKVPFSYTVVDGEGNPTTVSCKSYSTLTFTRDETLKLDAVPTVAGKSYELANHACRFTSDEARAAFEAEVGMTVDAWLAIQNSQITETNSRVLRIEPKNKLVFEKIVGSGITISEAAYYIEIGAGGAVTLYNTEKGRDDKDESDVVTDIDVIFTVDGKTAVVSEGTDAKVLFVYQFEKDIVAEVVPSVSGKAYKLSEYSFRFASDGDRTALEAEKGKTLDAIIAELNATITETRYKTLVVTDDGKIVCETMTESGSTIAEFTYYAVAHEDGKMTLYKTAEGREAEKTEDLASGISITVTASGVEVATPTSAGSESVQLEVYAFDKNFEEESVSDPKGNVYKLSDYGFKFASEADIAALETAKGKTVAQIIKELNETVTETAYKTLTVSKDGKFECVAVSAGGVTATVFDYYGVIGEDGKVSLYKTKAGRDNADASQLVTNVTVAVTAKGIEVSTPIPEAPASARTELYVLDKAIEESGTDVLGKSYLLFAYNYRFDSADALAAFEKEKGKTVAQVLADEKAAITSINGKRVEFEKSGAMRLYQVCDKYTVRLLQGYYDIAEDGAVTLYTLPLDRNDKTIVDTDLKIRITSSGIEISVPFEGGWHIELYQYEKSAPVYNGVPTVAGSIFESVGGELRYYSQSEKNYLDKHGMTTSMLQSILSQKRSVYLDAHGRIYSLSASGTVVWLYYFAVNDDGSITRYKTEDGRDNRTKSDIVDDGSYFSVSPDGTTLEWRMLIDKNLASQGVFHMDIKESIPVPESIPGYREYFAPSLEEFWYFDETGKVTIYYQNQMKAIRYHAVTGNGEIVFYYDESRTVRDGTRKGKVLCGGDLIYLADGTSSTLELEYTSKDIPTFKLDPKYETEYVEGGVVDIVLRSGTYVKPYWTTNSDAAYDTEWFRVSNSGTLTMLDDTPQTAGNYIVRVTIFPSRNYCMLVKEVSIKVITMEELTAGCTKLEYVATELGRQSKTFNIVKGRTYALTISNGEVVLSSRKAVVGVWFSKDLDIEVYDDSGRRYEDPFVDQSDDGRIKYKGDLTLRFYSSADDKYLIIFTADTTTELEVELLAN